MAIRIVVGSASVHSLDHRGPRDNLGLRGRLDPEVTRMERREPELNDCAPGNARGVVGDKTGTGATYGARNDVAVVWPPDRAPIVSNRPGRDAEHDDELIARAARQVIRSMS